MKFGVIGAGPSGLSAIRHCLSFGCEVIAFEQTDKIGGMWAYTDETDKDKNGLPIHSSMYQNLNANIIKDIMKYPDFPFEGKTFMSSNEVLMNLNDYARAFDLQPHIKFEHQVLRVRPVPDNQWEILVKDFTTGRHETFFFDAVLVCRGYSDVIIPKIPGQKIFKGQQKHSHHFRSPKPFEGENVLVIGGGTSGIELAMQIGEVTQKLYFSHHTSASLSKPIGMTLPPNAVHKPDVAKFTENGAIFTDGSFAEVSTVFYATGYDFTFPFMSVDCGLSCQEKFVQPLYKHCININRPSMAVIALPYFSTGFSMFDLQVRFCLTLMTGRKQMPSREDMLKDTEEEMRERFKTLSLSNAHFLGLQRHAKYYEDLAKIAGIEGIKPIHIKMYQKSMENLFTNYNTFRNFEYKIIDEENFVMTERNETQ